MEEKRSGNLLTVFDGAISSSPPLWLMRQAGRYLPEYRQIRAQAGSFWQLCMTPSAAAEATLQPVRRFDFDAAILFSDILVVPFALGKQVVFEEGSGPRVEITHSSEELCDDAEAWLRRLEPVYEAMSKVAADLPFGKDLIGFAGGPWTLATYMIEGQGSRDQAEAKLWAYFDPEGFRKFLLMISECVAVHLCAQAKAGATVLQLFDSWAGGLSEELFRKCVIAPSRYVVEQVRKAAPDVKIIGFPRGATQDGYVEYVQATGVDCLSLDTATSIDWAVRMFSGNVVTQGNLDPLLLVAGGRPLREAIDRLLRVTREGRHIMNLGHGVLPQTPVEHVAELVRLVRSSG